MIASKYDVYLHVDEELPKTLEKEMSISHWTAYPG